MLLLRRNSDQNRLNETDREKCPPNVKMDFSFIGNVLVSTMKQELQFVILKRDRTSVGSNE